MKLTDFRRLALALPGTVETSEMGVTNFRVSGRIFATLTFTSPDWGMVKLHPREQERLVADKPEMFRPVPGDWGYQGHTDVRLAVSDEPTLALALQLAWRRQVLPKRPLTRVKPKR